MKIGFDIGGVLSKYPKECKALLERLNPLERHYYDEKEPTKCYYSRNNKNVFVITDQHPILEVTNNLRLNAFCKQEVFDCYSNGRGWQEIKEVGVIDPNNVYCADYEKYGNMAKAVLIRDLGIDIFIDDFDGYLQWDSSFGPQPLLLKVMPDAFKPYWADSWKCDGDDFGRRKYVNSQ